MALKKPKVILSDVLENLEQKNYKKFCSALVDRDRNVKRNQVENKDFLDVAEVMVNVYDKDALKVAEELLREICCVKDANNLAEEAKKAGLHTSVPTVGPSPVTSDGKHFVDKHRRELINRVGNIGPILDELLDQEVLDNEAYNKINALPTNQDKVRELCTKYLNDKRYLLQHLEEERKVSHRRTRGKLNADKKSAFNLNTQMKLLKFNKHVFKSD